MIDKSIPYYPLTMIKTDTKSYPRYSLPAGYEFVFYNKGDEARWAEIETDVGQFSSVEKGIECFTRDFVDGQNLIPRSACSLSSRLTANTLPQPRFGTVSISERNVSASIGSPSKINARARE